MLRLLNENDKTEIMGKISEVNANVAGGQIVLEKSGAVVTAHDSAEVLFAGLSVLGKSTQAKTNGYQLFDASKLTGKTASGVTLTNNGDGSFTIAGKGEVTNEPFSRTYNAYEIKDLLKVGNLYLNNNGQTSPVFHMYGVNTEGERLFTLNDGHNVQITQEILDAMERITIVFYANVGTTIEEGTIKPMLYQDGDGTWEPFSGGMPAPNPEYPQEVNGVENPEVKICGKNLARRTSNYNYTTKGINMIVNANESECLINGTVDTQFSNTMLLTPLLPAGTYTVSVYGLNKLDTSYDRVYVRNNEKVFVNYIQDGSPKSFELNEPSELLLDIVFQAGTTYNNKTVKIQLERGDVATEYEPYKVVQPLSVPQTLYGIPVASGGNYTDENGQQWICDEVDFERGVLVKRTGIADLGKLDWYYNESYAVFTASADNIRPNTLTIICSHYKTSHMNSASSPDLTIYGRQTNGVGGIGVKNSNYNDVATFKTDMLGVKVLYDLAVPTETALTEEELEAYKALHSNKPNTTIFNNAGAGLTVDYVADAKIYIDNKFEEIKAMITAE